MNNIFCHSQQKSNLISGGTTVLTIITDDSIWIASDSRNTTTRNNVIVSHKFHNKINHEKNIFFVTIGSWVTMENEKGEVVFDSKEIIRQSINEKESIDTAFTKCGNLIVKKLDELFNIMPLSLREELVMQERRKLIEIIMASNDGERLLYKLGDIGLIKKDEKYQFVFTEIITETGKIYKHGHKEEITKAFSDPNFGFELGKIKEQLIQLIELEIKANPEKVGGTIDVLVIYKNGYKWLTNNIY